MTSSAKQSVSQEGLDCFVAAHPLYTFANLAIVELPTNPGGRYGRRQAYPGTDDRRDEQRRRSHQRGRQGGGQKGQEGRQESREKGDAEEESQEGQKGIQEICQEIFEEIFEEIGQEGREESFQESRQEEKEGQEVEALNGFLGFSQKPSDENLEAFAVALRLVGLRRAG
jgi:hypothetical protein